MGPSCNSFDADYNQFENVPYDVARAISFRPTFFVQSIWSNPIKLG